MLKNLALSSIFAALLLAGCNQPAPQPRPSPTAAKTDYLTKINALTKDQRNATFYRAITDADFFCENVVASQSIAAVQQHPAWDARCTDGQHWTLFLLDNGIIQVVKGTGPGGDPGAPANKM